MRDSSVRIFLVWFESFLTAVQAAMRKVLGAEGVVVFFCGNPFSASSGRTASRVVLD